MAAFQMDPPPILTGSEAAQLVSLKDYLYKMSEALNVSLNSLTLDSLTGPAAEAVRAVAEEKPSVALGQQAAALKSLIVKTAHTVQVSIDKVEQTLKSSYLALSDFGEYQKEITNIITTTAEGVVQGFKFDEAIKALQAGQVDFDVYKTSSEQYIKTGLLYYETDAATGAEIPRFGVAVGEVETEVTADGETILYRGGLVSTFTSDKLSFWQNNVEMAYFQSAKLFVNAVEVKQSLTFGNYTLRALSDGSMALVLDKGAET